jgi:endonuclease-8
VPEGDTILYAANRMRPVLSGRVPDEILTPHPRFGRDRWPERLAGKAVTGIDTHGKHLLMRFEGGLAIHSHLRMTGMWFTHPQGKRWRRPAHRAWLVLRANGHEVVQFDGPVLELLTDGRTRFDQRLANLGPDILADEFDSGRFLRRLREDDPTRDIGEALLDQRVVAGIGNMWKAEGLWHAQVDPFRKTASVTDEEALAVIEALRPRMKRSAEDGFQKREQVVYDREGRACPRCRGRIKWWAQGDDARSIYWCPGCQR